MQRKDTFRVLVVSGLGLGYLPVAPGTWGSAGAAVLYVAVTRLAGRAAGGVIICCALVLAVGAGVALAPWAEKYFGKKDPGQVTLDEMAGQWLACLICGAAFGAAATPVAAFVVFRIFDVRKPFPIRRLEKLPGGWGVMLDDLAAALYTGFVLWLAYFARFLV